MIRSGDYINMDPIRSEFDVREPAAPGTAEIKK